MTNFSNLLHIVHGVAIIALGYIIGFELESIELTILQTFPSTWNFAQIVSRVFIAHIFLFGIIQLLSIFIQFRQRTVNTFLWLYTLSYLILFIFQYIGKGVTAISISFFTLFLISTIITIITKLNPSRKKTSWPISIIIFLVSIATSILITFVLNPIYPIYFSKSHESNKILEEKFEKDTTLGFSEKRITLFATTGCPHCARVLTYLSIALKNEELNPEHLLVVFPEGNKSIDSYLLQYNAPIRYTSVPNETFYSLTGNKFPLTYFSINGQIKATWHTKGFTYSDIPIIKSLLYN